MHHRPWRGHGRDKKWRETWAVNCHYTHEGPQSWGCNNGCFCLGGLQTCQRCNNETLITHDSVSLASEYGAGLASSSSGVCCQSARGCDCEPRLCASSPSVSALLLVLLLESPRLCGLRPRGCSSVLIADPKLSLDACFFHGRLANSLPTRPAALLVLSSMSCALFKRLTSV